MRGRMSRCAAVLIVLAVAGLTGCTHPSASSGQPSSVAARDASIVSREKVEISRIGVPEGFRGQWSYSYVMDARLDPTLRPRGVALFATQGSVEAADAAWVRQLALAGYSAAGPVWHNETFGASSSCSTTPQIAKDTKTSPFTDNAAGDPGTAYCRLELLLNFAN